MNVTDLPYGELKAPIEYPHFPARWQAVVWRNWELVPPARLAQVLRCSEEELLQAAAELGLPVPPKTHPKWLTHGYLTIIRANWQLLPYSQILELLDWPPEKMAYTLKEEDFFWSKVGKIKPNCPPMKFEPLTAEQRAATAKIKGLVQTFFPKERMGYMEEPFAFADNFAPQPPLPGTDKFEFNYIHSYMASCGDVLGNADSLDPVPENLLSQYASMGIKGIWFHAILYLLFPIPGAEEYSVGHEKRLDNLKRIVKRCDAYGIRVYLYLNEPRCMPAPFYEKKPDWAGVEVPANNTRTICTTRSPEPLQWLEDSMKKLFREVEGLGGAFCITMSENPTNCHYAWQHENCPYCKDVPTEKIISGVIRAMERGMHASAPNAKMIVYDWSWRKKAFSLENNSDFKCRVLDLLPRNVYLCSVSEWGMHTHVGGVPQYLVDYSISQVGPSQETLATWKHARSLGIPVVAKVQINNSWELSAVPYIPVPYLIEEHLDNLKKAGVSGLMLSWTLGGFPGGNLDLLKSSPDEIASSRFHGTLAKQITRAWKQFSEGFREFPFHVQVLYRAPMNYGPMNLLHLKPTGYTASMVGFPYDDIRSWRGPYPEKVLENQFKIVTEAWREGLRTLKDAANEVTEEEQSAFKEILTMSEAAYCHLRSTYCQIRFTCARNSSFDKMVMAECVREEMELAMKLYELARNDSRIGFEASNHYFYSLNDLREKMISCAAILEELAPDTAR